MLQTLPNKEKIEKTYQEVLNTKAQLSKTHSEVVALKQNHFQKYLPSYVSIIALFTSFLLGYLASKWAFKSQVKLEEQKKVKELEFKNIDIQIKAQDEHRKLYMEANKYQPGIIMASLAAGKIHISVTCMAKKYTMHDPNSDSGKFLKQQMEEQLKPFIEHNANYVSDFKNYVSALSGYKMLKGGHSKINAHILKITNGITFEINTSLLDTLTTPADVDVFMKEEKVRFMKYWKTEIKNETYAALDIVLNNE